MENSEYARLQAHRPPVPTDVPLPHRQSDPIVDSSQLPPPCCPTSIPDNRTGPAPVQNDYSHPFGRIDISPILALIALGFIKRLIFWAI